MIEDDRTSTMGTNGTTTANGDAFDRVGAGAAATMAGSRMPPGYGHSGGNGSVMHPGTFTSPNPRGGE